MPPPPPNLFITARRLVEGLFVGQHPSLQRGPGVEFYDHRPYTPGDDISHLDWKVWGRTDRLYLRRHRRESDLAIHIFLDVSPSMAYADPDQPGHTKLDHARRLAAVIAMLAARQGDRVGLSLGQARLHTHLPPRRHHAHLQHLIHQLENAHPLNERPNIPHALKQLHPNLPRRTLLLALGDWLDELPPLLPALDRLRHAGHEITLIQILTPTELHPYRLPAGPALLRDPETRAHIQADPAALGTRAAQLLDEHRQTLRNACHARGLHLQLAPTDQPLLDALKHHLTPTPRT